MRSLLYWLIGVVLGGVGAWVLVLLRQRWQQETIVNAEEAAKLILEEAQKESSAIKKEAEGQAKDILLESRTEFEKEHRERRKEVQQSERRLQSREETLEKRAVAWTTGKPSCRVASRVLKQKRRRSTRKPKNTRA
jgi:ribonuclease Y